MVWSFALRYPGHIAVAALALLFAAGATSGVPYAFKLIIDKGFATGGSNHDIARWFEYLLLLVAVMALATAVRFYFVSWLGERTVADIRLSPGVLPHTHDKRDHLELGWTCFSKPSRLSKLTFSQGD